jgi:HdeA/HdeB family
MQRHVPVGELLNQQRTIRMTAYGLLIAAPAGRLRIAVLAGVILMTGIAAAQDRKPDAGERSVAQYTCKDVMRESGGNRDVAIAFLHGFMLGKSGGSAFNVETLRKQTDAFIERCLDNPGLRAADVMSEIRK